MTGQTLSEQNTRDIHYLTKAVEALVEVKRTNKALEARRMKKHRENAREIEKLEERIEDIAKQSGISPFPSEDTRDTRTTFFVPEEYR